EESLLIKSIALKIAWQYRVKTDEESEKRYLFAARNFYSKSFASNQECGERIQFLHAELSLRLGDIVEAKKGCSRLIADRNVSPKYRKLARNRWENYKYDEQPITVNEIIN
uniref:DUF2225 domain-containing protein n=1 Tax=Bacillus velezensis TaxID=492670 RepID=UPI0020BE68BB